MKKITFAFLTVYCCLLLVACNMATPENYFDQAVLNCNMITGFAGYGLERELEQPSARLVPGTKDQTEPMKRKEVINEKIKYLEQSLANIRQLKETPETNTMLQASLALYNYVLPVYKNEYVQLAKLYDNNAPKEQTASFSKSIKDKYFTGFETRFNTLISTAKPFAANHHINVNWDVKTSPDMH